MAENGQENPEAFGSAPSCSPSQYPAKKPTPDLPWNSWYCLEIQVVSTEDDKVILPPSHMHGKAPIVEDMIWEGSVGLMEAIVTSPGWAILFYVWQQSLGEGLSLGEATDTTFTLSGIITWVGKQAQLSTKPVSFARWQVVNHAQAVTKGHIHSKGAWSPLFHSTCISTIQFIITKTCPPMISQPPSDC